MGFNNMNEVTPMKMLDASTPESLRGAILKYLDWRISVEKSKETDASTARERHAHKYAATILADVRGEIAECILLNDSNT
jgi:hypothetical protein